MLWNGYNLIWMATTTVLLIFLKSLGETIMTLIGHLKKSIWTMNLWLCMSSFSFVWQILLNLDFVKSKMTWFFFFWTFGDFHRSFIVGLTVFPSGSDGKESAYNAGDSSLIPGLWRSPGEGNDNPFQYSCLEYSMDRGAWQATVHEVAKSRTLLSD